MCVLFQLETGQSSIPNPKILAIGRALQTSIILQQVLQTHFTITAYVYCFGSLKKCKDNEREGHHSKNLKQYCCFFIKGRQQQHSRGTRRNII